MKKIFIPLMLLILLIPSPVFSRQQDTVGDILDSIGADELYGYMQDEDFSGLYGYSDPESFVADVLSGRSDDDPGTDLFHKLFDMLTYELKYALKAAAGIFVMGTMGIFVKNLSVEYLSKDVSSAVSVLITLSVSVYLSDIFFSSAEESAGLVNTVSAVLGTVFPGLLILIALSGSAATANIISPVLSLALGYAQLFINGIIIPCCIVIFILTIADCVTEGVNLKSLISTIKKAVVTTLGIAFTVVGAVLSVEGMTFSGADKLAFRAARYAAGSLIPVVGSFLSGSAETFFSLVGAVKGIFGMIGVMVIISVLASPAVRMFAVYASLKVTSSLLAVFSDDKISDVTERAASCLGFLLSINVAVSMMSIMMILIIVNTTSMVI